MVSEMRFLLLGSYPMRLEVYQKECPQQYVEDWRRSQGEFLTGQRSQARPTHTGKNPQFLKVIHNYNSLTYVDHDLSAPFRPLRCKSTRRWQE